MDGNLLFSASKRLITVASTITVCMGLVAAPLTYGAGVWTNEPSGASVALDCSFNNSPSACGILDVYSSAVQDSDGSATVSPSGVARSTIYAGNQAGGSQLDWVSAQTYNEMYMGMMVRTNTAFEGRTTANKMFFLRGPGQNGFWGLDGNPGDPSGSIYFGHNSGTLDNSHTCSYQLGLKCFPNVNGVQLVKGVWTKVEAYVKKSTTATSTRRYRALVGQWRHGQETTPISTMPLGRPQRVGLELRRGTGRSRILIPSADWSHGTLTTCISPSLGGSNTADQPPGPPAMPNHAERNDSLGQMLSAA
jgi:hypothetical protein